MFVSKISALALAAALSFGAATFSFGAIAQDAPSAPPAAHQGWDREAMHKHMQEHIAAHVKMLHDALNLRADQESAFSAVVTAMHPHDGEMGAMDGDHDGMGADHAAMANMTTPERLDMMARKMDERAARMHEHMQRVIGSVKVLYAQLSPEQRKTFDALARAHEMGKGHEHGMGEGHMGGEHGE